MEYGRYRIKEELGKGTMGVVYRAYDPQIDREIALKVLRPDRVVSEAFVARFLKEARAIGRLSHPQIVTIYDVGEDNNTIYIAMEYLEGRSFDQVVRARELGMQQCVDTACQIAEALDYAHSKGIIHRDIKPSNIIFTADNRVKLTDFGIARIEDTATAYQTQAGEILGTPVYMSPEQVMGQKVDGRSDLYSLGVLLYELLLGRRPFTGNNIAAIFRTITQDTPEAPVVIDPFIPKALSDLVMKSLEKDAKDRFQTGRQMAAELKTVMTEGSLPDQKPVQEDVSSNRKSIWKATVVALLLILAIGAYWWWMQRVPQPQDLGTGGSASSTDGGTTDSNTAKDVGSTIQASRLAVLQVSTEPTGAQVYVDGLFKGRTPLDLDLKLGKYEVRLNLPEYFEWEGQINLDVAGTTPLHIPLRSQKTD
jgi:serine/threonine protein kinase